MSRLGLALLASVLALATACTEGGGPGPGPDPARRTDLLLATGASGLLPSGVAVDPTGARYFFDEDRGLYREDAGRYELVLPLSSMPDPGVLVRPPFTDLVAIGPDRFAITAIGDGYLLDTALGTMRQYFCYVPDDLPPPYDQRTDAVTYDPAAHLLYAQPRTFDEGNNLIASQIATYSEETGADLTWTDVRLDLAAGGMAIVPGLDGLVLGNGSVLYHHGAGGLVALADLAGDDIGEIGGLAVDAQAGTLLVLDRARPAILELDLAAVAALAR